MYYGIHPISTAAALRIGWHVIVVTIPASQVSLLLLDHCFSGVVPRQSCYLGSSADFMMAVLPLAAPCQSLLAEIAESCTVRPCSRSCGSRAGWPGVPVADVSIAALGRIS